MAPGVRMEYARAADGTLARASTALKGPDVQYRCLDCGERLKLRRGDVRAPHFSHLSESGCSGEGVIHHAAKLELARALTQRERPFTLEVPCSWPGCPCTIPRPFDVMLGAYTHAVTEYTWQTWKGEQVRFDVATLLHGDLQVGLEVYHAHRVPEQKKRLGLPSWVEVHAAPLLEDPYRLVMVKDDVPVNPQFEAFRGDPQLAPMVEGRLFYAYRARGSGRWVEEEPGDREEPHIDHFDYYVCFTHTLEHERLLRLILHCESSREREARETALPIPPQPDPLEESLRRQRQAALFAARFYDAHGIPPEALTGVTVRAGRCAHCGEVGVFVMSAFVPQYYRFQGLLSLTQDRKGLVNHCGSCRQVVSRKALSGRDGVTIPGEVVAAAWRSAHQKTQEG
ncbi:competence protein CoiA family protein [Deinococcus taklimakanensis]|uniref:Competence protein CoiA family protein n=1 Tax=Deinococcus taklimakanensis TaxID=536443 RepID=A0ABW5P205_9DEIO